MRQVYCFNDPLISDPYNEGMTQEVINMAIHENFYIYAGLAILALALSIGLFSWLNGVHPGALLAPGFASYINKCAYMVRCFLPTTPSHKLTIKAI